MAWTTIAAIYFITWWVVLFAVLPFYFRWLVPIDLRVLRVLRLFRLLKLVRYSPALQTLGRVIADEYRALLGALLIILVLLLFASTAAYFLEREAQPDKFGSIPAAAWWALATLTTVGYGDIVPVTPFGKVLGGLVILLGVGMIALPVAIIATGFNQESNRHQFVVTWSMIARVPLFATMDESEIAEITKLLYTRTYLPGVPIVRAGGAGDAMYLIAGGEAEVEISGALRFESGLTANSSESLRVAALAGMGLAVLPTYAISRDLRAGRLTALLPGWTPLGGPAEADTLYAVYLPSRFPSPKVRALIDFCVERWGDVPPWDRPDHPPDAP